MSKPRSLYCGTSPRFTEALPCLRSCVLRFCVRTVISHVSRGPSPESRGDWGKQQFILVVAQEAVIAERFVGCQGVVQLLDAFYCTVPKPGWCLVFDLHDASLDRLLDRDSSGHVPLTSLDVTSIFQGVLQGIACVHTAGFLHADLKPGNILVRRSGHEPRSSGHEPHWTAVVGDLGSAVEARRAARETLNKATPLRMQTLWWRAPEIFFDDENFGVAADLWSCGLVLAELAGCNFHTGHQTKHLYLKALFQQLGTPECKSLLALKAYPASTPPAVRKPWPETIFARIGSSGHELLDRFVQWDPSSRMTAADALQHPFFEEGRLMLVGGVPNYTGKRHEWNMVAGQMPHDVLMWLRADPTLSKSGLKPLNLRFDMHDKKTKSEENRKIILAGYSYCKPPSTQMCCLSLAEPLPLQRFEAWAKAFRAANADSLADMSARALRAVSTFDPKALGENGSDFVGTPLLDWFATCGELCITAALNKDVATGPNTAATCWSEPLHQDGGASVLHLGVTLFGRRKLVCHQGSDVPPVELVCPLGSVYLGVLTGPEHQVHHLVPLPGELLRESGVATGPQFDSGLSITIMCRTALFAHNQARLRNVTPSPQGFFFAIAESFRASLAALPFRLPELHECHVAMSVVTEVGGPPAKRCRAA